MSTRSEIIKSALLEVDEFEKRAVEVAKNQLFEVFKNEIHDSVSKAISEQVSPGKDQPSGYDQDADQDALAFGSTVKHKGAGKEDINKGGKGPQKLEATINVDEVYDEDELDETDDIDADLESIPVNESEEDELDEAAEEDELDEAAEEDELDEAAEEDELDEKKCAEDELDETKVKDESINQLQKEVKALKKENIEYKKAFAILKRKTNDVNLLNTKLSESLRFLRKPNLSVTQKEGIVEAFDKAKSVREVKLISNTLAESVKNLTVRKPVISTNIKPVSSKKMNESFDPEVVRLQELAGLR